MVARVVVVRRGVMRSVGEPVRRAVGGMGKIVHGSVGGSMKGSVRRRSMEGRSSILQNAS